MKANDHRAGPVERPRVRAGGNPTMSFRMGAAAAALAMALAGCASPTSREHYFAADSYVTAAAGIDPDAAVARAIDDVIRRGESVGLRLEERRDRSVQLVGTHGAVDGDGADQIGAADQRRIRAGAWFDTTDGGIRYRYRVFLDGRRPAGTTAEYERRLALALLAVREVFETPVAVHLQNWPPVRQGGPPSR